MSSPFGKCREYRRSYSQRGFIPFPISEWLSKCLLCNNEVICTEVIII